MDPPLGDGDGDVLHPIPALATGHSGEENTTVDEGQTDSTPFAEADEINTQASYPIACIECLRASSAWAMAGDVLPMRVACTFNTRNAVECDGCVGAAGCTMVFPFSYLTLRDGVVFHPFAVTSLIPRIDFRTNLLTPSQAPSGMLGDLIDILAILNDAHSLCTLLDEENPTDQEWNDNYALSRERRQGVARAANECVAAFLAAEEAHRGEFGLGEGVEVRGLLFCAVSGFFVVEVLVPFVGLLFPLRPIVQTPSIVVS